MLKTAMEAIGTSRVNMYLTLAVLKLVDKYFVNQITFYLENGINSFVGFFRFI